MLNFINALKRLNLKKTFFILHDFFHFIYTHEFMFLDSSYYYWSLFSFINISFLYYGI